jgi:DNA-binding IclR family transcriptional regulator
VFEILALFGARRRPLSATEIRDKLNMPHSSTVSLLWRLVALGYLEQNAETKRYFPSLQLTRLCESVPGVIGRGSPEASLVDNVHAKTAETTSLSRLCDLFTLPLYVRPASYLGAHHVTPGCTGGLATQSVVGQSLLSHMTDDELDYYIQRSEYWARRARVSMTQDGTQVMRSVSSVRETGYLCAYNQLLRGVGVVSYPLPQSVNGEALAVTVAGPVEQVRRNAEHIVATLRNEVDRQYGDACSETAGQAPRAPLSESAGRYTVFDPDFSGR